MIDELIAEAELGEEARNFLASDLGRFVLGVVEQDVAAMQLELEVVPPTEVVKIIELQQAIKLARSFPLLLNDRLIRGEQAKQAWVQQQENG